MFGYMKVVSHGKQPHVINDINWHDAWEAFVLCSEYSYGDQYCACSLVVGGVSALLHAYALVASCFCSIGDRYCEKVPGKNLKAAVTLAILLRLQRWSMLAGIVSCKLKIRWSALAVRAHALSAGSRESSFARALEYIDRAGHDHKQFFWSPSPPCLWRRR